jgi:hypothetical protein
MRSLTKLFLVLSIALIAVTGAAAQNRARDRDNNRQQQGDRWRVRHNGRYYNVDTTQADILREAIRQGYQQGYTAGRDARSNHRRNNYRSLTVYREGTYGYSSGVERGQYQYYFQQGFDRGWQDGYNSRFNYGRETNGAVAITDTILNGLLNLQRY